MQTAIADWLNTDGVRSRQNGKWPPRLSQQPSKGKGERRLRGLHLSVTFS
jgi:hypothetical protein